MTLARRRTAPSAAGTRRCACCDEPMETPHFDHHHRSGELREWVCARCNHNFGTAGDDHQECVRFAVENQRKADAARTDVNRHIYQRRADRWIDAHVYLLRHRC